MIRVSRTRSLGSTGILRALLLSGALAIGFAAGQVAPDVASLLSEPGGARVAPVEAPSLGPADDYALRHRFVVPVGAPSLGPADDYALRHRFVVPVTLRNDDGSL